MEFDITLLTKLTALLAFLAGPAGIVFWMLTVSTLIRNLRYSPPDPNTADPLYAWLATWLRALSPLYLYLVVAAVSILPPVIAKAILEFVPATLLAKVEPYYGFIALLFVTFFAQQIWYRVTKPGSNVAVAAAATGENRQSVATVSVLSGAAAIPAPLPLELPKG